MIKGVQLTGFEIQDWIEFGETDQNAKTWIWNQLMGETSKGDILEFVCITRGDEKLYAGLLRDSDGTDKGIVPAMFEKTKDGILKSVDYRGVVCLLELDSLDPVEKNERMERHIDDYAWCFLTSMPSDIS